MYYKSFQPFKHVFFLFYTGTKMGGGLAGGGGGPGPGNGAANDRGNNANQLISQMTQWLSNYYDCLTEES